MRYIYSPIHPYGPDGPPGHVGVERMIERLRASLSVASSFREFTKWRDLGRLKFSPSCCHDGARRRPTIKFVGFVGRS